MIVAVGQARAKAGRRQELVQAAGAMVTATRRHDGCLLYTFAADLDDPDVIVSVEVWRDQAALDAHMARDHTATFLAVVPDLVAETPDMQIFTAREAPST